MKFLNKIISVILIVFFLVITGENTIAYLYFKVNQKYIAKNLCVQKDLKDNFCMGNCYLAAIEKRLNKNKEKNSNNKIPVKYNSSNYFQEYLTIYQYRFNKTELVFVFHTEEKFQVLIKNYAPATPPPRPVNFV